MNWIERLNGATSRLKMGQSHVEILQWAYSPHLPDNVPHRHTYFEICQVGAYGAGQFIVESQAHIIKPNDVFVARPGVVHQIRNTQAQAMELRWVCFGYAPGQTPRLSKPPDEGIEALWKAFATSDVLVAHDDDCVQKLWNALQSIAENPRVLEIQIANTVSALLLAIAQCGASSGFVWQQQSGDKADWSARLSRLAVQYVHDNLNRRLTIEEIAAHVHISPRHLARLFTRFTGTTPAAYIECARLDRARALLRDQSTSIKEVATQVGYADVHHFSRVFTRRYGTPPGEFRRHGALLHVRNIQNPGALV